MGRLVGFTSQWCQIGLFQLQSSRKFILAMFPSQSSQLIVLQPGAANNKSTVYYQINACFTVVKVVPDVHAHCVRSAIRWHFHRSAAVRCYCRSTVAVTWQRQW